ncbi:lysine-specific demethylase 5B isoform X4 [Lagenorhynchus albirostris]|uniref:lysine-specific demethylase 5B isoform X3 n=1 Tax=Sagmatias obliquidens TaxID=3371155 RepID=UPI000F441144|nr:lysine-specific demethylase 5B isoform X3 [Lagenorhynchus obliquidens]XP_059981827.1 lysine-specific demethylase 5B isoform X4 [Lagenorhynchus albirostris]
MEAPGPRPAPALGGPGPLGEFLPPPECPVFEPSWEEFADPFAFIHKIRPIAEQTGICKVRPPPDWQPPFACDVDKLHFTPRIQRLNELEAQTRVKLNFLDQIAKYWELQGSTLKIPHVERKILDLFQLNKLVAEEGGFAVVCKDRKWTKIATKMGFAPGKAVGSHIRGHYERILNPYNLFLSGDSLRCLQKPNLTTDTKDKEYKPHDIPQRQSVQPLETCPPARRAKRMRAEAMNIKIEPEETAEARTHNLRRRMGCPAPKCENEKDGKSSLKQEPAERKECITESEKEKPRSRAKKTTSAVDLYVCLLCGSGNDEDRLLLCDGCDDSYHTFCLIPPLHDVPKGDWRCPKCLAQECSKPQEAFGFEQAARDYTLRTFGEMADAFKSDYFNMPVHMVPTELVEKEFWRLVSTIEEDVTVEYGADIASKEFGSGFPVRDGKVKLSPEEEEYLDSGWNLNNMPVMEQSVLAHITADICGMKLPWLYVGMCFSSFCWHIEDHWSYSINYLHWGEPKTWYGVPGYAAEQLETVMKRLAPELFISQPDLLHQLVTIMNPNTLMTHEVPVYRTNQCAGEFVITFPRAYHSGFNQGFNFAEAVNFCTVDWLPLGRQCVEHYRLLHRYCVFSHDEMICKMASKADVLDVVVASTVQKDMAIMIEDEKALRETVRKLGVIDSERMDFELLPDDERQCVKCKTTCFMSAISCSCKPGLLVCLHHVKELCSCPSYKYKLRYRYTLDDLYPMMNALKLRAESYNEWALNVNEALEAKINKKKSLVSFKALIEESEMKKFPDNDLLRHLRLVTQDAEKCASVAQQLLNGKRQTRYRSGGGKSHNQLTVNELRQFVSQLHALPCVLSQTPLLKDLLNRVEDFQQHSQKLLSEEMPSAAELQDLLDVSFEFDVELPQLAEMRVRLEQAHWLEEVQQACLDPSSLTLDDMRRLIDLGVGLAPYSAVEKAMARLQELLTVSEHWDDKARSLLKARPRHSLNSLATVVKEIEEIPAYLPNGAALKDSVQRARDWLQDVEALQAGGRVPVLDTLIELVTRGRSIPVHLNSLPRLESLVAEVHVWKECAANTFLTENSSYSLLEMATLGEARLREMEALQSLRQANEGKLLSPVQDVEMKVCLCQKAPAAPMIQCELCRDAFHTGCVAVPSIAQGPRIWLCPHCRRSEKPPLEKILPLLASLQRIRVRLPEGDALRYMIERTVNWQHRARQLLSSGNLQPTQERTGSGLLCGRRQAAAGQAPETSKLSQPPASTSFSLPGAWDGRTSYLHSPFSAGRSCIPLHGLSPEVSELLMEAQLLQVSLPEIQELYQMLLAKPSPAQQADRSSPVRPSSEKSDGCRGKRDGVSGLESKLKRRLEREGLSSERWDRVAKTRTPKKKRIKLSHRKDTNSFKLERARGHELVPSADTQSLPADASCSEHEDSGDEDAVCPAVSCLQPEGDEVDWVQCDGSCNRWFHQVCVGVCPETAEEEDYVCACCAAPGAPGRS